MKMKITKGELQQLDERLTDITKGNSIFKIPRLKNMMFDIDHAFDVDNDTNAKDIYMRAGVALSDAYKEAS